MPNLQILKLCDIFHMKVLSELAEPASGVIAIALPNSNEFNEEYSLPESYLIIINPPLKRKMFLTEA